MKIHLLALGWAVLVVASLLTPGTVSAAVVFSENFDDITLTTDPLPLETTTPGNSFTTVVDDENEKIPPGSITALSDASDFFGEGTSNQYLEFIDGLGTAVIRGPTDSTISGGGFTVTFDFYDPDSGHAAGGRFYSSSSSSGSSSVRTLDIELDNGTFRALNTDNEGTVAAGSYTQDEKHTAVLVGNLSGSTINYIFGSGQSVAPGSYDIFVDGTLLPNGDDKQYRNLDITQVSHLSFSGLGNNSLSETYFDNIVVENTVPGGLTLTVDRDTGDLVLGNTTGESVNFLGYSMSSSNGAFVAANWKSITGNYDDSTNGGDESVDDDEAWTILGGTTEDLSEFVFGGNGGNIAASASVVLSEGTGVWLRTPDEESLSMEVMLFDGTLVDVQVEYQGNGDEPLKRSDFNLDGSITSADWDIFRLNNGTEFSSLTAAQGYHVGDLDGDLDNDSFDFAIFQSDYDLANGGGAFSAMLQSVPEPSSLFLLGLGILGLCFRRKA